MKTAHPGAGHKALASAALPAGLAMALLASCPGHAHLPARPVPVVLETAAGNITVEVNVAAAPVTGANFLKYVDGKFYDGGMINRAVRPDNTIRHDVGIQVIQFQSNPARGNELLPPIPMERTSVTGLKHLNGALSMARMEPDTAQASFSIIIGDQPEMDFGGKRNPDGQGFAVFGRVVAGMDVVSKIHQSHTGADGAYQTETLEPAIKILKAYRKYTEGGTVVKVGVLPEEMPDVSPTALYEVQKGDLWIGTQQHGLHFWHNGAVTNSLSTTNGLAGDSVNALLATSSCSMARQAILRSMASA
ncbi:MAG: peptidylprolyl isomerase [Verrucomicrobia bacterium]|nr:peptidylprolyl isomerase [Verrucomicrobiota bacterium]